MKLFKTKNTGAPDKAKRRHLELIFDESGRQALAFGLQWKSIVVGDIRKAGIAMARAQGATHFLMKGQGGVIGFGSIDLKANPTLATGKDAFCFPAAQVAARQYGGDAFFLVKIGDGDEYWLSLVRNGEPTSTDIFLTGSSRSAALATARKIVEDVSAEGAKLTIYSNVSDNDLPGVASKVTSVEDLLMAVENADADRMSVMPKAGMTIPKPILIAVGLGMLVLVGQQGYKWWQAKKRAEMVALNRVDAIDPAAEWAKAISAWELTKVKPGQEGLILARNAIGSMPILWEGWALGLAKCSANPMAAPAPVRGWSCTAIYERTGSGKLNREMATKIPSDWIVSFTPLNKMQVTWTFMESVKPLVVAEFKPESFHNIDTTSRFQSMAQAFATEIKLVFAPVSIPAPIQKDGTALPADATVAALHEAVLSLSGPLRSIDTLITKEVPADWTSLSISFLPAAPTVSIKSSAITADVTGVIYAKN